MNSVRTSSSKRQLTVIAISLAIILTLSAPVTREAAAQTIHEVKIADFAFVPQNLAINPGDTIIWNNTDPVIHTLWFVFAANGSTYLLSDPILPEATWNYTFNDAVELQYYSFDKLWITGFINITGEIRDIALTDVTPLTTVVGQGYTMSINVTVENRGDVAEVFDVTVFANASSVASQTVSLASGNSQTVTFSWNTSGFAFGNYSISAYAEPVPGETNTDDNTLVDGWVSVAGPGDVNADGIVDIFDCVILALAFGSAPGDPNWNPNADINNDQLIDIFDLVVVALHFGETYT